MKIKVQKLHPDAKLPVYATQGSACFDLHALDSGSPHPAYSRALIFRTGLAFEVPKGWVLEIHSRSGQGFNNAIRLSNCTGEIDSDYRGEVMVSLRCDGDNFARFHPAVQPGYRIAQAKLIPVERVEFELCDELPATTRGVAGFGSTGS